MSEELPTVDGRQDRRSDHGATMAAISRRIVGLLKEYYGKGPTKARTYQSGDLVVVVLAGGYTQAERTLIEQGRGKTVLDLRAEFQEVMGTRFKQVIQEELRRDVLAFMSAAHHDPDYNVEVFILAADGNAAEEPAGASDGGGRPG
jgi:uncharacterized protein YbcI